MISDHIIYCHFYSLNKNIIDKAYIKIIVLGTTLEGLFKKLSYREKQKNVSKI